MTRAWPKSCGESDPRISEEEQSQEKTLTSLGFPLTNQMKMKKDYYEVVIQVLYSYPDETIDALIECFDEALDYILEVFDRPLRYCLLAEELVWILQNDSMDSGSDVDTILAIFLRHGVKAVKIPPNGPFPPFTEDYVRLGPILVAMGNGQERAEEEDILCAAESLCRIRMSTLVTAPKMK
eukprot:scaffold42761_cov160-Amphora_coffeaeformis.AAC.2